MSVIPWLLALGVVIAFGWALKRVAMAAVLLLAGLDQRWRK